VHVIIKKQTYVIGDIHGRLKALNEVLNKAGFRNNFDRLITLGDIVDGGINTKSVIERLLQIKDRIDVRGNHETWALNWMKTGEELPIWTHQGGYATMRSYDFDWKSVPSSHIMFLESQVPYYIDDKNRIFVHGGFNPLVPIENQTTEFITWDRTLIKYAQEHFIQRYNHVYIGHTTTQIIRHGVVHPLTFHNMTMMDTGGGWNGRLSMIDVDDPQQKIITSKTQIPREERGDD
jgi:serine/threonine protein phosphatase 1